MTHRLLLPFLLFLGVVGPLSGAGAHETDQYTLPTDRPFADVGAVLDAAHCLAIERAAERLNRRIDRAIRLRDPGRRERALATLYDPRTVADAVYLRFNDAFFDVLDLEFALRGRWAGRAYPGERVIYRTFDWIYTQSHAPFDLRRLILIWQSSTIKSHGVYFGTDKLSHFHHMGKIYYDTWQMRRALGDSDEEAVRGVVKRYSGGGALAENALLGYVATGVYSNADLVANYTGFKFFRNLTEPVELKGEVHPPLLVRVGPYWKPNKHVRPESGWFGAFISDHWNEALNPNKYDWGLGPSIRPIIEGRAEQILAFYTERDGRPAYPRYFDDLAAELRTYYGEEYGHAGSPEQLLTLAAICFPATDATEADSQHRMASGAAADETAHPRPQ